MSGLKEAERNDIESSLNLFTQKGEGNCLLSPYLLEDTWFTPAHTYYMYLTLSATNCGFSVHRIQLLFGLMEFSLMVNYRDIDLLFILCTPSPGETSITSTMIPTVYHNEKNRVDSSRFPPPPPPPHTHTHSLSDCWNGIKAFNGHVERNSSQLITDHRITVLADLAMNYSYIACGEINNWLTW